MDIQQAILRTKKFSEDHKKLAKLIDISTDVLGVAIPVVGLTKASIVVPFKIRDYQDLEEATTYGKNQLLFCDGKVLKKKYRTDFSNLTFDEQQKIFEKQQTHSELITA